MVIYMERMVWFGLHGKEGWSYDDGCKIRQRPGRGRLWATVRHSCNRSQIKHVLLCFFFARTDPPTINRSEDDLKLTNLFLGTGSKRFVSSPVRHLYTAITNGDGSGPPSHILATAPRSNMSSSASFNY